MGEAAVPDAAAEERKEVGLMPRLLIPDIDQLEAEKIKDRCGATVKVTAEEKKESGLVLVILEIDRLVEVEAETVKDRGGVATVQVTAEEKEVGLVIMIPELTDQLVEEDPEAVKDMCRVIVQVTMEKAIEEVVLVLVLIEPVEVAMYKIKDFPQIYGIDYYYYSSWSVYIH